MTIGLELRERGVAAVRIDEGGIVLARERRDETTPASVAAAIAAIGGNGGERRGMAVRDRHDRAAADAAAAESGARVVTRGTALALAEQWCGAAVNATHVVALSADDGVHAGIIVNGRPFEGAHGLAGAAAWLALNPVEREDYRRLGCLETEIGANGIVRRLVWRVKAGDGSRVVDMAGGDLAAIDVRHVFQAAREGDGVAISVVRDTAKYVGMAIGNLVAIVDPDVVVLGGVIAGASDVLLEPTRVEVGRRVSASVGERLTIVPGTLGDDAGPIGAARAAMLAE